MKVEFDLDVKNLDTELQAKISGAVATVENAMAEMMNDIVIANFGPPPGRDRPEPWADLSDRSAIGRAYILKVNRTFATLFVTGAMANAVRLTPSTGDGAKVSLSDADCPYATRHHFGDPARSLPIRRVFPINLDGSITEFTRVEIKDAAYQALAEALK